MGLEDVSDVARTSSREGAAGFFPKNSSKEISVSKLLKLMFALMCVGGLSFAVTGCEEDTVGDDMGDSMDDAAGDMEDAADNAADETDDALDDAGDNMDDAMDN